MGGQREKLTADSAKIHGEYSAFKNEIREVEVIRKHAESAASALRQREKPARSHDMEL
ncbi:hypothetical protein FACS1894191_8090 [Clostridia bacterium]|nr:hypothetical protein FACS1894191_8090 [Clostridia bacterium]